MLLFWVALRSNGSDWYISQTHADIFYTAVARFHQFPFFSFIFNGGTYFIQDPQNNLFSPTAVFIPLAGPSVGLRLISAFWGALGAWAFIAWMRRRVSLRAAQLGALAWLFSLGILWRIAVGNDMFLWHLGLPLLLLTVEDVMRDRTVYAAVAFGLTLGVYLLGPTLHSLIYLLIPTLPTFCLIEVSMLRPGRAALLRITVLIALSFALALIIVSPKLVCWTKFAMHRPTSTDGVLSLSEALRCLVDYTQFRWSKLILFSTHPITETYWGLEEGAVALPPLATILAAAGMVAAVRTSRLRRTGGLAAAWIIISITIACSPRLWDFFRTLTRGSFRVAPRFLGLAGFGMAVWATVGADDVLRRLKSWETPVFLGCAVLLPASAVLWTHAAGAVTNRADNDVVQAEAIRPWARRRLEVEQAARIASFKGLVPMQRGRRQILDGFGLADGFIVVGNPYYPGRWPGRPPVDIVEGIAPAEATVEHTRIELRDVAANAHLRLRIIDPQFGLDIDTVPRGARIDAYANNAGFLIDNRSGARIDRIVLRPRLPISLAWFWMSAIAICACIATLIARRRARGSSSAAA